MDEKKKSIIYFIVILLLALAFIVLYLLDSSIEESQGSDAITGVIESIKPALENQTSESSDEDNEETLPKSETVINYEEVKIIDWDVNKIDSIQVYSQRKNYTLINHGKTGEKKWSIRSVRVEQKIVKSNNALFKLLNVFEHFKTDNNLTRDYSEFSKYFEYPICTIVVNFKDGRTEKLTFIRIAGYNEILDKTQMMTWVRVNEETVVYSSTYNLLERFLVAEEEFLKLY